MTNPRLFICGCPRTGTTALWHTLMASESIFLGVERYGALVRRPNTLSNKHFEEHRFFNIECGDTFYTNLFEFHEFKPYAEGAKQKYGNAKYLGDKIPKLYKDFSGFSSRFPEAKIIFMLRNIYDTALSYKRRSQSSSDSFNQSTYDCVQDWNEALRRFSVNDGLEFNGLAVEYERLFNEDTGPHVLSRICSWLEIDETPVLEYFEGQKKARNWLAVRRQRESLPAEDLEIIEKLASKDLYDEVREAINTSV